MTTIYFPSEWALFECMHWLTDRPELSNGTLCVGNDQFSWIVDLS